jgi:hypothetical protein
MGIEGEEVSVDKGWIRRKVEGECWGQCAV